MDGWIIWLVVAVGLAVAEALTLSFFLFPFAIGAAVAGIAAALGAGAPVQLALLAVTGTASLVVLRPVAQRHLRTPPALRTGTAALVGRTAVVLEQVTGGAGTVKLEGEVWTARPLDEDAVIPPGTKVHVIEIRGATALVTE